MKDYQGTLRKILRKTQYESDGKIIGRTKLTILDSDSKNRIWTNGKILVVDDPTMIKSIGGEWLIKNYLKKEPVVYKITAFSKTISITGEINSPQISQSLKKFLEKSKKDLVKITIKEFEKRKYSKEGCKDYRDSTDYIQKTFFNKDLETFVGTGGHNLGNFLYFFEGDQVRAVTP